MSGVSGLSWATCHDTAWLQGPRHSVEAFNFSLRVVALWPFPIKRAERQSERAQLALGSLAVATNGQARREDPDEPVRFECGSPSICGVPMKPENRMPKSKRRQLIPVRKCVILRERCA